VTDIQEAHTHLEKAGIANGGVQHFGPEGLTDGPHPEDLDYGSYIFFDDPDGNTWAVQQVRKPAR